MNNLVLPAWEMLLRFTSIKKFNFIPSFIGMLWLFVILLYQTTFTYVYIFHKKDALLESLAIFAHKTYFVEVIIGLILLFVFYMIITPIAEGGIVEMIHTYRKSDGQKELRSYEGFFRALKHYLPLFEVHNLIAIFRPLSVITFYILLLRIFGSQYFVAISLTMGGYLVFAFFMNMCFAYAKFFVIFEEKNALQALSASTSMTVNHIDVTLHLYYTTLLVYLRTILAALFFFGLPFTTSAIITFFTLITIKLILLSIFGLVTLIFFIFLTYLNSTLEIFVEATWYEAYILNKKADTLEDDTRGDQSHRHTHHDDTLHQSHDKNHHSEVLA